MRLLAALPLLALLAACSEPGMPAPQPIPPDPVGVPAPSWDGRFPLPGTQLPTDFGEYPTPPFDLVAFDRFLRTKPTPAAFRDAYPQIELVVPGQQTKAETRYEFSRFFADIDKEGRVVGGYFL